MVSDAESVPTLLPDATHGALGRRIHRFLVVFERYARRPNRREAYYLMLAIECLRDARYKDGEAAMSAAERLDAVPEPAASTPGLHEHTTAADVRAALRLVISAQGCTSIA